MDPGIIIPVKGYGGIERIIEMLAKEYLRMGNEVELLITYGSSVEGCLVHGFGKEGFPPYKWDARKAVPTVWEFLNKHKHKFDFIHNFGRLIYLLPILNHPVNKIMSYQREITRRNIKCINALPNRNMYFTGCSQNLVNRVNAPCKWSVVYNACEFSNYRLENDSAADAPLFFLGRIEKIKGCHTAIEVAKATGSQLIIAGNISTLPEEKEYYEREIFPQIDGKQIKYIGTVNDAQKNEWLGQAKALLFPIEWEEPFGIVMVEAMACGTPVIAFNTGSVNEVIDEGITGFKVNTKEEMIDAVKKVGSISRSTCRQYAKKRFDINVVAREYLNIISNARKKIVLISTHQPTANPRLMKEYETLKSLGYNTKVLYAYNAEWSHRIDEEKFKRGILARQDFIELGGNPQNNPIRYFIYRVFYRLFKNFAGLSLFFEQMSISRVTLVLWRKAIKYPADLYVAHYLGALPAATKAAAQWKAKMIFDAEDFHRGEQSYYPAQVKAIMRLEEKYLPMATAITAASPLIAKEYKNLFPQQKIVVINNVFSKKYLQPHISSNNSLLKLFWFSQNIGQFRGLEVFIKALNELPQADISLTIMGNRRSADYEATLLALSKFPHKIVFRDPIPPQDIFAIAAEHDIGLAGEIPNCFNKEICLSNKIFAYLLASNCILASDMQGQKEFMNQNAGIGFIYQHNDAKDLAGKIEVLYNDRTLLNRFKTNAGKLAEYKMNWDEEQQKWLDLVEKLIGKNESVSIEGQKIITMDMV